MIRKLILLIVMPLGIMSCASTDQNDLKPGYAVIDFDYTFTGCRDCSDTVEVRYGDTYTIFDQRGGCGMNDIARCIVDNGGRVQAYILDSCETDRTGNFGEKKFSGCSRREALGETVTCCKRTAAE